MAAIDKSKRLGVGEKQPAPAARGSAEGAAAPSEALCDTLRVLTARVDESTALSMFEFARDATGDARSLRASFEGYAGVLHQLRDDHKKLADAGQRDYTAADLKTFLTSVADLADQLSALRSAIQSQK